MQTMCKCFHMQALHGGPINIYATDVVFLVSSLIFLTAWPCWSALFCWKVEKGWLMMCSALLPHMPALFTAWKTQAARHKMSLLTDMVARLSNNDLIFFFFFFFYKLWVVAQLVQHQTGAPLMQVQSPCAARFFSPSHLSAQTLISVSVHPCVQ